MKYTAAEEVVRAHGAESAIGGMWATAYRAAAADIKAGGNVRDLAQAITAAGVKCSKDTASDMVRAYSLTVHGSRFDAALSAHIGEGKVMRAHSLIAKARKARGAAYVDGVLKGLDGLTTEKLEKALAKAVRELDAAKRKEDTSGGGDNGGDGGAIEGVGDSGDGDTVETTIPTVDAMLASVIGPTAKMLDLMAAGEWPTDDAALTRWITAAARIAELRKQRINKAA